MASIFDWSDLVGVLTGQEGGDQSGRDGEMGNYYGLFTKELCPPDFWYLSYASVTHARPHPAAGSDPYFYLAEFYRRVVEEHRHAVPHWRTLPHGGGHRLLATGSGLGGVGHVLAEMYPDASSIVCLDIVEHQIDFAKRHLSRLAPQVSYEVGDVCALAAHVGDSFDVVYDEVVISHLRGSHIAEAGKCISEFKRVLTPGGQVVLSGYAREPDLDELFSVFAAHGFDRFRCVNITAANAEGGMRSVEHMLGRAASRRLEIIVSIINALLYTPDKRLERTTEAFLASIFGRLVASCRSADGADSLLVLFQTHIGSHIGSGHGGVFENARSRLAAVEATPQSTPALRDADVDRYGHVIDATLFGLLHTHLRGCPHPKRYKPCWVVVLQAPCRPHAPLEVLSTDYVRASPFTLPLRLCNSAATLWVMFLLRLGRVTRYFRSLGKQRCGDVRTVTGRSEPHTEVELDAGTTRRVFAGYLRAGKAAVVRNAIRDWPAMWTWTPQFLTARFGDIRVKIQGETFGTNAVVPLRQFLSDIARTDVTRLHGTAPQTQCIRYSYSRETLADVLRSFGQFRLLDWLYGQAFTHACFRQLTEDWAPPVFLPPGGFTFPWTLLCAQSPRDRFFYDFGVYIAPRGGITRLHVDSQTNAVLCIVTGTKRCVLIPPSLQSLFVNSSNPPKEEPLFEDRLAQLSDANRRMVERHVIRVTVHAGDLLFVPRGWMHEVFTEESSVMLTYNFIHGLSDLACALADSWWHGYGGSRALHPSIV
eukprot:Hpha_TRINITY_DN17343_c0_g1::TRINITY_DN17343_c0_g1_i1::g.137904::m.137904